MKILKISVIVLIALSIISCQEKKSGNMIVEGTIKGMKKGTIYLQKVKDTAFVSLDSVSLVGSDYFKLATDIESPEMFYISLGKNNTEKIPFFGEKGIIEIQSNLEKLALWAKVSGSKNQELLEQFNKMLSKFSGKNLELLKQKFDNYKEGDKEAVKKVEQAELNLQKRKILYVTNFALSHIESEVAPYIALISIDDNNIKLLDTINKSLSEKVKNSIYGKQLGKLVNKLKANKQ